MTPSQARALADRLVPLSFLIQSVFDRACADHDTAPAQARLLGVLQGRTPLMAELARLLGVEKSSLTGLIDRAERKGLVRRVPTPGDRRATRIELTPEGRRVEAAFRETIAARMATLTSPLPPDAQRQLIPLLDALLPTPENA
ncbi:MarR family transcriptional regulator [Streptantibioticus parmotrematis]|uniref:MarR family winged helix-turn-helix transcriptional regulator n=1 Tax=Streptantibioticus parmotrematis TaxID=2873249 RepID=UPI0033FDF9E8